MSFTASQICLYASRIAKGGTGMVALAGQALNLVLEDLWQVRNLMVNRVTQNVTVQPASYGPFDLPPSYARTYDLWYPLPTSGGGTASSMTQFLAKITMEQFDSEFKSPSISNYPYEFACDLSSEALLASANGAGQFYIYPQTSGQIVLTHRYMIKRPDITNPETSSTVPWFEHTQYLIQATAAQMMQITGDDRWMGMQKSAEELLRPYLIMQGDEQPSIYNVKLDPRHFHYAKGLKPTKASPL